MGCTNGSFESYDNGVVLTENEKNKTQFKVNEQRLKPYIEFKNQNFPSISTFQIHKLRVPSLG